MKQTTAFALIAIFFASVISAQSSINIYAKNNNEVPKIIERLEALPAVEKAEKEHRFYNFFIYVKKGEEQSYKEIQKMWNDPVPRFVRLKGKIKAVLVDEYAGKFDEAILKKLRKSKNKIKSAELVDKGVFIVEFKDPGSTANGFMTNYFGRVVSPRPNPMTYDTFFKDIFLLPSD